MTHRAVIDRVEGELAVLDIEGCTVDIPLALLPEGVREGQVLELTIVARDPGELREEPDAEPPVMDIQL